MFDFVYFIFLSSIIFRIKLGFKSKPLKSIVSGFASFIYCSSVFVKKVSNIYTEFWYPPENRICLKFKNRLSAIKYLAEHSSSPLENKETLSINRTGNSRNLMKTQKLILHRVLAFHIAGDTQYNQVPCTLNMNRFKSSEKIQ